MQCIDLTGAWNLRAVDRDDLNVPAAVPGDTHSALLAAGKIPDPYAGTNELDVQFLNRVDWEYSRSFDVPAETLAAPAVYLVAERIDTVCEILINGSRVAESDNMFARIVADARSALRAGENTITIRIRSAEKVAEERAAALPYPVPHGINIIQSMHRNLVRKVQCHSGWDWGCCLMVSGIYDAIFLQPANPGRIEYVYCDQEFQGDDCRLTVHAEVRCPEACDSALKVSIGGRLAEEPVRLQPGLNAVSCSIAVPEARRWWPAGHGPQPLYELAVEVAGDRLDKKIGLRELELINEEDATGRSLFIRVNGRDIFCKGANWIPPDALPQRHTREAYRDLLVSAADANMNMLRVWGGGQYELPAFYELCDELGILIWQDFMFSCSLYPSTPGFLKSVRAEAEHQVKRLRDHASLALWCGNNENVGALNWFQESRKNRDLYLIDYDRLNEGVLGDAVRRLDPARTWWPSSPCGGPGDFSDCWHADNRGDMHYWSVWHEGKNFEAYYSVKPRFCSEFGFQAFPSFNTVKSYAEPDQWNPTAPVMEHHQRNRRGNSLITETMTRYFRVPNGFDNFIYLSQVQQALAIKTAVEHWRHLQPTCMGALFWQLNDNWPVCSWSSINYAGEWKLLQYAAKRFFAPLLVSAFQTAEQRLELWVTHDGPSERRGVLTATVFDFDGNLLNEKRCDVTVPAGGASLVSDEPVSAWIDSPARGFLQLALEAGGQRRENTHFFDVYKHCELAAAKLEVAVRGQEVELTSDKPAFFVAAEVDGDAGRFDDNMLTLLPGARRTLRFDPREELDEAALRARLTVRHLRGTY